MKKLLILILLIPSLSWGLTFKDGKQVDDSASATNNSSNTAQKNSNQNDCNFRDVKQVVKKELKSGNYPWKELSKKQINNFNKYVFKGEYQQDGAMVLNDNSIIDRYEFFDELPLKAKEFFKGVMDFFTVTIPEKIQAAKDTVSQWFTDAVAGVKQFFSDIWNFFTVTIPLKISEVYTNVTNWFGDIVGGIKGFFTDAFDFVTETIPEKIGEITKNVANKFVEIKDKIIDFALTPFRKVREYRRKSSGI